MRLARPADLGGVLNLARLFHTESIYAVIPIEPAWLERVLARMITDDANALVLVAGDREDLFGFFVATLQPLIFTRGPVATQHLAFIRADKRGGAAHLVFLRRFLRWATDRKAIFADYPVTAGIAEARTSRGAQRLGFTPAGGIFRHMMIDQHNRR